jgi:hypothetical protein
MTYEDFFKDGDKFLYESYVFNQHIVYDVEIVDMRVGYHSMEVKFKRMGDSTRYFDSFAKLIMNHHSIFKIKKEFIK